MRRLPSISAVLSWSLATLLAADAARGDETCEVRGKVVDEDGRPVAGATVDSFWRANGPLKGDDGRALDLKVDADVHEFWGRLGRMEPSTPRAATTGPDGRFAVVVPTNRLALMAMDDGRRRGGLAAVPKGQEKEPLEIRIGTLVKLRGSYRGPAAGEVPTWTHTYLSLPEDQTRPLDSSRLVGCGSYEARFEFSMPPGRYVIYGYNDKQDGYTEPINVRLAATNPDVDLGILALSEHVSQKQVKIASAKAEGRWVDVADRYGEPAPPWHITDARGVSKDSRIEDFKGKWVLVYFWGVHCAPCLRSGLPELVKFYEDHAPDRDRFEVVAICLDNGELASMADVDRKLKPIIEHVWGGRSLPFPVALDVSSESWVSFGLSYFGPQLVDPEGRLVQGDEKTLAEKLDAKD